tara:strand:+ start:3840 stop:4535 length:696 start_codon:yes stop_codon:yes gene_type:complete
MMTCKKGTIYKLNHKTRDDTPIYIGMTTRGVEKRFKDHEYSCHNTNQKKYNFYVYQFIRDYGGFENWECNVLKDFTYETNKEKKQVERDYIENAKKLGIKLLNKSLPNRGLREWQKDNPDKMHNSLIRSRLRNREKHNKIRHQYYLTHKEKMVQNSKNYYLKNKKKIDAERNRKVYCPCGGLVAKRNFKTHLKTDKHKNGLLKNIVDAKNSLKRVYSFDVGNVFNCIVCPK